MFSKKTLSEDDLCSKYIFREKSELRQDGKPRSRILVPRAGEQLSLFEVTELAHDTVCKHGHEHVDDRESGRIHIGYVKFLYESFGRLGLQTVYDNDPPRHVSVTFSDIPEYRRELAKALADEVVIIDPNIQKKYFAKCT